MRNISTILAALMLSIVALSNVGVVQARSALVDGGVLILAQAGDIGASAAASAASAASGGRVLGVKRKQSGARIIYRVKVLLPGGRVRTMSVNGQSGQVQG